MPQTIAEELKATFHLVALRSEANTRLTGRQWQQRKALVDRCHKARQKAEELNFKRYPERVVAAQKKLIDKAGAKTLEHRPSFAQEDRFDKAETLDQAQSQVKAAHERRIGRINQYEERGLSILLSSAERANRLEGKAERAFDKVSDRRRSAERRQTHRLKRTR